MDNSHLLPITVNGFVLYSIFDDSDGTYHADLITHRTPAEDRQALAYDCETKA